MEHRYHVFVARDDPGMKIWVPINRRLLAKPAIERIRIRKHLRIEQVIETQRRRSGVGWN
jgi:hypothetical protein